MWSTLHIKDRAPEPRSCHGRLQSPSRFFPRGKIAAAACRAIGWPRKYRLHQLPLGNRACHVSLSCLIVLQWIPVFRGNQPCSLPLKPFLIDRTGRVISFRTRNSPHPSISLVIVLFGSWREVHPPPPEKNLISTFTCKTRKMESLGTAKAPGTPRVALPFDVSSCELVRKTNQSDK